MHRSFDLDSIILRVLKDAINFDFPEESNYNKETLNQITLSICFNLLKEFVSIRSHKKLKTPELIECLC